jgi:predicted RNA-binding Zn-ribbon protein involved in translation (DUF1610 family)
MDNVDRMYRHLVRTVRSRFPQYLTQAFDVGELHQTVLPYRHHRRELGLETNEEYEITLTELLSGARDYLIVDDRMRDALKAQLASVNPDPSAFKKYANASVALSPAALRSLEAGPIEALTPRSMAVPASELPTKPTLTPRPRTLTPGVSGVATPRLSGSGPQPVPSMTSVVPAAGERCRACDQELPPGRPITFCPHCGQNVTTMNCTACGSELELGWKFCPTCGRPA